MSIPSKYWRRLGFGLAVAIAAFLVVRSWVIPAVIVGQIQSRLEGKVTIRDWWVDGRSAGVVGLTIHEGRAAGSPVWATVDRVSTDLSLGHLLRARFTPRRITLHRPDLTFRLDREGRFLNLPALRDGGGGPTRLPGVSVDQARVTFRREGRAEPMVVSGATGRLEPDAGGRVLTLSGGSDDPTWGHWDASGSIEPAAHRGDVRLHGPRVQADPRSLRSVAFVPAEVWSHVAPHGPVEVDVTLGWAPGAGPAFRTSAEVRMLGIEAESPTLGLVATDATGRLRVEGGVVRVVDVRGHSLGGEVVAGGTLDFSKAPARVDLDLHLGQIDVARSPASWQLGEAGITGRLTGDVALRAVLDPAGVDLSGSSGEAVVEKASIQGIPVKSLRLAMRAKGGELQYDTKSSAAARMRRALRVLVASLPRLPWEGPERATRLARAALAAEDLVALQAPPATTKDEPAKDEPGRPRVRLPQSLTTQIELEDVEVAQLVAKAQLLSGFPFPLPVNGRLTLKATATIPLGAMRDVRKYAFHGDATLKGASIFKVDFGRVSARLDLADGVLELKHFRGVVVDHPDGGPDNPPGASAPSVADEGPLPPGGFRGELRAELSPPGPLSARLEGSRLPLGEMAAPALPRPTPLSGLTTFRLEARADLRAATDPAAWTASGEADGARIRYRGATLDGAAFRFRLENGHLEVPSLTAQLQGHPLKADAGVDLKPPRAFRGALDVSGWDLASVVALMPNAPQPSPIAGTLSARASARGTLMPWSVDTSGDGRIDRFRAGPVPLGEVPFRWATEADAVVVSGVEARPFGGHLRAEARVPLVATQPVRGSATITGLDTAQITAAMPGQALQLTGRADAQVAFAIPPKAGAVEANVRLSAPELTVQGIPADRLQATVRAHQGALKYEVTADSLGGKVKFQGDFPLGPATPARGTNAGPARAANGELRVVGFTLEPLWKALDLEGAEAQLLGVGALDANVRQVLAGRDRGLWAHGIVELRDLSWGPHLPLGHLRGIIAKTPTTWRVDPLGGEVLGGTARGVVSGTTPARGPGRVGFTMRVDSARLDRLAELAPTLAHEIQGVAAVHLEGTVDESLRAEGSVQVAQARVAGLPVSAVNVPLELVAARSNGAGTLTIHRASARVAGGQVRGDASFGLGVDRSFQGELDLAALDLQTILRNLSDSGRPNSGRITGKVTVGGTDPGRPESYRGRVVLDLDDASLFALPVFREIDRFLGSARGGLFDDGDLVGSIGHKQLVVEMLTLEGRLVQLHAAGTVGFDTQLNLEVLINTNQIIPETGAALVGRIPGLNEVLGRNAEAMARVGTFLSNRLLKLRVTGTLRNPSVSADASVVVTDAAIGFFGGVLKLPLGFLPR